MKTLFNVVKVLSVAALVSSCAYENDPGLTPKDPNANQAVSDPYAKMKIPELLTAKYQTLTAECTTTDEAVAAGQPEGDKSAATEGTAAQPQPATPTPVVEDKNKTTLNLIDQQKVDAELTHDIQTQMVNEIKPDQAQPAESTVTVKLTVKPMTFVPDKTEKIGSKVYVLKHSPKLSVSAVFSIAGKDNYTSPAASFEMKEGIELKEVVATTGKDSGKRNHILTCNLKGVVVDKPEAKGQWLMVDCAAAAPGDDKPEEKKVFAANCRPATPPPTQQPVQ